MSVFHNNALIGASGQAAGGGAYEISRSLRFNSADSAYLDRTPSVEGNRKTWTWAGWVKRAKLGATQTLFMSAQDASNVTRIRFESDDTLRVHHYVGNSLVGYRQTTQVFRDVSAWYHIVWTVDTTTATGADRIKIFINGTRITAFASTTDPSQNADLFINSTNQHKISSELVGNYLDLYLADIHFIDGQALDPTSFTEVDATTGQLIPKAYSGSFGTNGFHLPFSDNSTAAALGTDTSGNGNDWTVNNVSVTGLVDHTPAGLSYRDSSTASSTWDQSSASSSTSATIGPDRIYWVDLGASKSFNRITFSVVASGQSSDTSTNFVTYFSTSSSSTGSTICGGGCTVTSAARPSATTPGTITVTFAGFASQTGRYIGITNGSGAQGGTYTYSNFKVYDDQGAANDSLVDTPTSYGTDTGAGGEVRGNYATLNPLNYTGTVTLSNGNLDASGSNANASSTIAPNAGKWYAEFVYSAIGAAVGFVGISNRLGADAFNGATQTWQLNYTNTGKLENAGSQSTVSTFTTGDVVGVAFDCSNGQATFYKNGSSVGTITGSAFVGVPVLIGAGAGGAAGTNTFVANFGQRPFAYTAPSGFKALCTTNLPEPTIADGSTMMDVKLYSGNSGTQSITGLGFSPDFVWIKSRSNAENHVLSDIVRGTNTFLYSDLTAAEDTAYSNVFNSFDADGFTLGYNASFGGVNVSGRTYAAWTWDAGSSTVTNTDGSITSSVRANPSAGFSIVTYTGTGSGAATIGHGLGVPPKFIIVKRRNGTGGSDQWLVYHQTISPDKGIQLNSTATESSVNASYWNLTATTSTVFSVGSFGNPSGDVVAYCFAPVAGYSAMGSWVGNGSATSGPFIYTGFRPRFLLTKVASGDTGNWHIIDTARSTYNQAINLLYPNLNQAESSPYGLDILSNGFRITTSDLNFNFNGATFVYAAFAESPFQYARAR